MYEDLIKRLRDSEHEIYCSLCDRDCCYPDGKVHGKCIIIEAADAIEELTNRNVGKWIPVTERLPKCNGCYLVWRPHFFGGEIGMPSICYFDGSNTWHDSYGVDFERILHPKDVTHWMPLPEPPKEEC